MYEENKRIIYYENFVENGVLKKVQIKLLVEETANL